ncbi:transferrin-binding protein-like solute binding protein [Novosphingobium pokkalii]|uniref:transferrin-binding protein-like solute binding protein n=1 Tax=Novosphingobium pokkalii TaxID=1770194 RepID=UPI003640511C
MINEDLGGAAMVVNYYRAGGTNAWSSGNLFGQGFNVSYSETAKALVVEAPINGYTGISATLTPAILDTALSNAAYDVYAAEDVTHGARTGTLRISRPGPANPVVALTYTGFGTFESATVRPDTGSPYSDFAFAFGEATPASAVPTSGSATYSGVILGYSGAPSDGTTRPYAISGEAHMAYNFAGSTLTGTLNPVATDRDTGTAYALDAYTFTGQGTAGKATFAATFDKAINVLGLGNTNGAINGQFTGPHAEEFYASWHAGMIDPKGGSNLDMGGVIVGKQGK